MKNCIVFGNCHVWLIRKYLSSSKTFNKRYRIIEIPPVHELNMEKGINEDLLKNCDLFIYQRVKESFGNLLTTNYILSRLPEDCIRISIANPYFIPYFPQFTKSSDQFPYSDKNVISLIEQGFSKEKIISELSDENFYSSNEITKILNDSMTDLRKRESDLDIRMVDFLQQHFRNTHLFCTINHPKHPIIRYMTMNILDKLGIPRTEISSIVHERFTDHIHPIYPSVIKHLNLRFTHGRERCYTLGKKPLTFSEYLDRYIVHLLTQKR
ncbi:WcbI family polysaccharide biosynthesis putative acetyltransferase [Bacillus haimaensis]|uniref:WcbI family polysaccharide biosynthesis putative acetyltransferase n=1 Tax=Bacillus haimaensis TaxID=3160967 RepID=UPI003AA814FF